MRRPFEMQPPIASTDGGPAILLDRDEGTAGLYHGVLISVWRTWMHPELLADALRAVEEAAALHPEGLALVSVFRLDVRFPIGVDFTSNLPEIARGLARVRRHVRTLAAVIEFEGFLAMSLRLTIRAMLAASAPSLEHGLFSSRIEALQWTTARHPNPPRAPGGLRDFVDAATHVCDRRSTSW
ncbi:MAG: hypothetical protein U0414_03965 [Polyangiaceae bacterium]